MVVKIEIFNNSSYNIELDDFKEYFLSIMKDLQVEDALVNIIIVDNEEIKKINKEYRNIDNVTDVISFALEDVEFKTPFRILGDIYISYEKVKDLDINTMFEVNFDLNKENINGLGLYIVKNILKNYNIEYKVKKNKIGIVFFIKIK